MLLRRKLETSKMIGTLWVGGREKGRSWHGGRGDDIFNTHRVWHACECATLALGITRCDYGRMS